MIIDFKCKIAKDIWYEGNHIVYPNGLVQKFRSKLTMLNSAKNLNDLSSINGNQLGKWHGGYQNQYTIRVNRRYLLRFIWKIDGIENVEIVDLNQNQRKR